jgi:diadenosine tetraphosphate (Ap4A) HIT family hydrolase
MFNFIDTVKPRSETMECLSCKALRKEISLSPAEPIYEGNYWQLVHGYPVAIIGWLVIVLRRHAEALHDLTANEISELAFIQNRACKALQEELGTEKEYSLCLSEKEGFHHIHIHLIGIPKELPKEKRGLAIFSMLGTSKDTSIPDLDIVRFSRKVQWHFE